MFAVRQKSGITELISYCQSWSWKRLRAVPEIILRGGGPQTLFCPVGGVLLKVCPRGGGGGEVTCPGGQGVFDP